jgi:hypothetical protein
MLTRKKRNKATRPVWHVIISGEDLKGDEATLDALTDRFVNHFKITGDWIACTHADHDHLHVHLIIGNADANGKPYNLTHIDNFKMINTLGFAEGMPNVLNSQGKVPFVWRRSTVGDGMSRKGSYANVREANSKELAEMIKANPGEVLAALIKSKDVEAIYSDKGAVSFRYKKTKFSLRDLNYFLGKGGLGLFLDTDLKSCDTCPVFISPEDLKGVEHDAEWLAKLYQPAISKALVSKSTAHFEPDILKEIIGLAKYRKLAKAIFGGPLGWIGAFVDFAMDLDCKTISPWER